MYKKVKLLTKNDKNLKVNVIENFSYAKELTQTIITVDEFFKAAKSQPIVFAKNKDEEYFASTLLGLEEKKNDFINDKGEWLNGEYIPAYVRRYPFVFVQEKETLALAYDDCKEINKKKGKSFFNKNGEITDYIKNVMNFMENFQKSSQKTALFIKELELLGLLEDANANMNVNGKLQGISVDIIDAMFKQMGSKRTKDSIKLKPWATGYKITLKKKNCMLFSTTRTAQRENLFKWVGPIIATKIGIIAPKEKHIKISNVKELNNYKIGAVIKDIGEQLLIAQGIPKHNIDSWR